MSSGRRSRSAASTVPLDQLADVAKQLAKDLNDDDDDDEYENDDNDDVDDDDLPIASLSTKAYSAYGTPVTHPAFVCMCVCVCVCVCVYIYVCVYA
jgi:hypothetical protein